MVNKVLKNSGNCPAVLISAPASGQGKTLVTAALARAWCRQGLVVQAFKAGPDFLDPMVLAIATNRPVYNLDLGMCGLEDGLTRLYEAAQTVDLIIVEGVMGLFDGSPSSADIAKAFGLAIIITIDASGMAQTFGAVANGLLSYQDGLISAGVIANKVGSTGHAELLQASLPRQLGWYGALPDSVQFSLPERHLGLFVADEIADLDARIDAAATAICQSSGVEGQLPLPPASQFSPVCPMPCEPLLLGKTIAIAKDEGFCFIYPANLDCLRALGATLKFFSPLHDPGLPEADGYWLPGGYPELHVNLIGGNTGMAKSLTAAFEHNLPIFAECGGMMALSEFIGDNPAFGLLPGKTEMQTTFQGIGTQFVSLKPANAAEKLRINAHTFHYSKFTSPIMPLTQAVTQYNGMGEAVYRHGSIIASYLHFYFPSNPRLIAALFLSEAFAA